MRQKTSSATATTTHASIWPYLVWIPIAAIMMMGIMQLRYVHVIYSYEWRAFASASYDDFASRHYTRCNYLAWGPKILSEYPTDGKCGWLRFAKAEEGALQ